MHHKVNVYRWLHKEDEFNSDTQRLLNAPRHLISKTCSAKRLFLVFNSDYGVAIKEVLQGQKAVRCSLVSEPFQPQR